MNLFIVEITILSLVIHPINREVAQPQGLHLIGHSTVHNNAKYFFYDHLYSNMGSFNFWHILFLRAAYAART